MGGGGGEGEGLSPHNHNECRAHHIVPSSDIVCT